MRLDFEAMIPRVRLPVRRLASLLLLAGFAMSLSEPIIPEYHDGDATAAMLAGETPSSPTGQPPGTNHNADAVHICHCVHVHGVSATIPAPRATPNASHASVPPSSMKLPASWGVPPTLRPPID